MKEIAQLAGVHVTTVSLVLSGQDKKFGISTKRSEEIRRIAERLGYRRNAAALAINRGSFGTIGLLMGHRWSLGHLPRQMLSGICSGLGDLGLQLLFAQLPDEEALRADSIPRLLRERCCDGVLISYDEGSPAVFSQLIQRYNVPAIWMNLRREADCVHPDDVGSGRAATELLLSLGHRRIAYSNFYWSGATEAQLLDAHYSMRDRRDGCLSILERAGLTPLPGLVQEGEDQSSVAVVAAAERLLRRPDRPTAVICFSLGDAEGLMIAANNLGQHPWRPLAGLLRSGTDPHPPSRTVHHDRPGAPGRLPRGRAAAEPHCRSHSTTAAGVSPRPTPSRSELRRSSALGAKSGLADSSEHWKPLSPPPPFRASLQGASPSAAGAIAPVGRGAGVMSAGRLSV